MLAALDVCPVGVSNLHERGDPIVDQDDLERWTIVVIPAHHLGARADRVLRQAHALGNVLLEHEPEAAPLLESVDLRPQVGTQCNVLDLVEEDVKLASDHAVRISPLEPLRLPDWLRAHRAEPVPRLGSPSSSSIWKWALRISLRPPERSAKGSEGS
jgi:hypothetical protein